MEKFLKLLENHEVFLAKTQSERINVKAKKRKDLAISSQASIIFGEGSETIIGITNSCACLPVGRNW